MHAFLYTLVTSFLNSPVSFPQLPDTNTYIYNTQRIENIDNNYQNYSKSIIYLFFNNEPCYACSKTIDILEQIYNQNFINDYNLFLINYQNDSETNFIRAYQLSQPLEVVLVKINDGASWGYRKIEGLENMSSDPVSLKDYFVNQVNEFLSY